MISASIISRDDRADVAYMEAFRDDFSNNESSSEENTPEQGYIHYSLTSNYRSDRNIVALCNAYANTIPKRMKEDNAQGLMNGSIELPFKTMLILDEYQDVSLKTYGFIKAIFEKMETNKRIIAVGDDDQCINHFERRSRGRRVHGSVQG